MNTLEAIAKRVSIRSYQPEQIPEEALQTILKAGMAAPVGSGAYDTLHLTVIQDMGILNEISEAINDLVFKVLGRRMNKNFGAPTMIVVSAKPGHIPGIEMANAATVLENMTLAATDLGLASIIQGGASAVLAQNAELRAKVQIPEGFQPALAISVGYGVSAEPAKQHVISVNRI